MSARVKAVLSGDTVVLLDKNGGKEQQLSLAYVTAPRLSEPWGFDSREFLRKLAVGKPVNYRLVYDVNGRAYGDISSPIFSSLVKYALEQGWVELRDDAEGKDGFKAVGADLAAAESLARSEQRGIWTSKKWGGLRVQGNVPSSLYGSGRQVPAIVERVTSGDRISIRAMMDPDDHYVGPAWLAGIRARRSGAGDAFGDAAAQFVTSRLLHRSQVRAIFVAPSPNNPDIPLVTLVHPQGDVALLLVSAGLAEASDSPQIGSERLLQLKNAQREAEEKGAGAFRARAAARAQHREAYASQASESVVTKVLSSDTVALSNGETVQLSSVRAPRKTENAVGAADAREFTRKLLIGKPVRVQVDGETSTGPEGAARKVVTLSYGAQFSHNAGLEIIRAGWATAMKHRRDDLARSPFYDELVKAEDSAIAKEAGIHGPPPKRPVIVDASETAVRARSYLSSLERKTKIPAVVDFVIAAGRFRLLVPSENCTIVAVLDGVKVPRAQDPFAEEALEYVVSEWNQRDVQISVRAVDKTGAFIAVIKQGSRSLAVELLHRGYATVHEGSANVGNLRDQFDAAQEKARAERKGVWADYKEPDVAALSLDDKGAAGADAEPASATGSSYVDAVLSYIEPHQVWYRLSADNAEFKLLKEELASFFGMAANASARSFTRKPRRGDLVVTPEFYRGEIIGVDRNHRSYDVSLMDIGSEKSYDIEELFPLPQQFSTPRNLARSVQLKYVHAPVKLYEAQFLDFLGEYVDQAIVVAGRDMIYTADSVSPQDSLNRRIISGGYASVPAALSKESEAEPFLEAQNDAKSQRIGMWEYGDPREDDDM